MTQDGLPVLPPRPRWATLRLLLLGLPVVLLVEVGAVALLLQPYPVALVGWLVAAVGVAAAGFLVVVTAVDRRGRTLVRTRAGGLELPASRVMWALTGVVLGGLLVLAVLFAVGAFVAVLSGGFSLRAVVGLAVWLGLLALAAPSVLRLARGDYQRGGLLLTPRAVSWSTYNSSATIAWDDLREVRLVADPARRLLLRAASPQRVVRTGGPESLGEQPAPGGPRTGPDEVSVSLTFLASDGAIVAEALETYRRSRSARRELGTPAAVERWRRPR